MMADAHMHVCTAEGGTLFNKTLRTPYPEDSTTIGSFHTATFRPLNQPIDDRYDWERTE